MLNEPIATACKRTRCKRTRASSVSLFRPSSPPGVEWCPPRGAARGLNSGAHAPTTTTITPIPSRETREPLDRGSRERLHNGTQRVARTPSTPHPPVGGRDNKSLSILMVLGPNYTLCLYFALYFAYTLLILRQGRGTRNLRC